MRTGYWACVAIGCAVVPVAPGVIAGYMARHPLPAACVVHCHWVIPPYEFRPGGELYVPPGIPVIVTPPRDWSQDWGSNTAPWPPMHLPTPLPPPVITVVDDTPPEDKERCERGETQYCHYRVEVPEPSSALDLLVAVLMLVGVRWSIVGVRS